MALGGLLCAGMGCTRHDTQPQQAPSATPSSSTSSRVRFVSQKRNDDAKEPVLSQQLQRRLERLEALEKEVEAAGEDVPRVQEASARLAAAVAAVGEVPAAGGEFA